MRDPGGPVMARHRSPPGRWEPIRKNIIEDATWGKTPAAFQLAIYLAAKPDGWVLHAKELADGTGLKPSTVEAAVRELRRRGLVYDERVRNEKDGKFTRLEVRFRRELVIAEPTPLKNRGVDDEAVTSTDTASSQLSPPPDFSPPWQKIAPIREDGVFKGLREDGVLEKTHLVAAAAPQQQQELSFKTSPTEGGPEMPNPAPAQDSLFPELPEGELKPNQLAGLLADQFIAAVPLTTRAGTFAVIKRAAECGQYTPEQIRTAVAKVAANREVITRHTLYYALEGRPIRANGRPVDARHPRHDQQPDMDAYDVRPAP